MANPQGKRKVRSTILEKVKCGKTGDKRVSNPTLKDNGGQRPKYPFLSISHFLSPPFFILNYGQVFFSFRPALLAAKALKLCYILIFRECGEVLLHIVIGDNLSEGNVNEDDE